MKKQIIILSFSAIQFIQAAELTNESYLDLVIKETEEYRKYTHQKLIESSANIDNYFFDEKNKLDTRYNDTYGFIELSASQNQHESVEFNQKVKIKFALPKLKNRLKLVFETDNERDSKDFIENQNKNNDFNLSLAYEQLLDNDIDFSTKAGIKLGTNIDPFIKVQAKKVWENIYGLDYILSQSFKESVDKKLESTSYFHISKKLTDDLYLHNYNEHYWQSGYSKDSEFYHSIYLNERLSNKNYLTYQIDTNIDNIDSNMKIKRYSAKLKFRHYIRSWLYTDVIPENFYREDLDFKPRYAIRFNLGMFINKDSY